MSYEQKRIFDSKYIFIITVAVLLIISNYSNELLITVVGGP